MNPDALLTRLRLEQRYLIDIDKKLHELEYLLPGADPVQFLDAAKRTALLSERSTAQLRSFLFTVVCRRTIICKLLKCRASALM